MLPLSQPPQDDRTKSTLPLSSKKTRASFKQKIQELERKEIEREIEEKAKSLGIPSINLEKFPMSPEALAIIDEQTARNNKVVCFLNLGDEIRLGSPQPISKEVQEIVQSILIESPRLHIVVYLISEESLEKALSLYEFLPALKITSHGVTITEQDLKKFSHVFQNFQQLEEEFRRISVTDLITFIIASAVQTRASDIHLEAEEEVVKVRYRIDGVLQTVAKIQREVWKRLNSRMKLLSGLKLNVTTTPQDGRFTIYLSNDRIDVRVSTLPTNHGESIVMRLLLSSSASLNFHDLGLSPSVSRILINEIARPNGMIITTGPTGSGKTTTLYAILNELNRPGIKIITIEDPIEYQLEGINQSQVDTRSGHTFASALRSMIRQDPDIIMVGEIRDVDTVEIAIQAALTGHLVFSTLHTNSAAGTIPRFIAMGAKSFLLAPSLNAVMGQRLVRTLCQSCRQSYTPTEHETMLVQEQLNKLLASKEAMQHLGETIDKEHPRFFTATGCAECQGLGYKGRIGIFEIFSMNAEIEKIILSGKVSEYEIEDIITQQGMITMAQDGILKALAGQTSLEEVFRVAE